MTLEKAKSIIEEAGYGVVCSCVDGQPRCRPMSFRLTEDFKLWSSTYRSSGKVREFEANPKVEVCFVGKERVHLRVEGTVSLTGGPEEKERLLKMNPGVASSTVSWTWGSGTAAPTPSGTYNFSFGKNITSCFWIYIITGAKFTPLPAGYRHR